MNIQFYDVRSKKKVSVSSDKVKKVKFAKKTTAGKTRYTYAVRAELDGSKLTKFVSEADWKKLDAPEVAPPKPGAAKKKK